MAGKKGSAGVKAQTHSAPVHVRAAYYCSRLASQTGQGVFFAFLFLEVGAGSGALEFSGVLIAMVLAAVVLGPAGGTLVDRLGPRMALVAGALLRLLAIACGLLAIGHGEYLWTVAFAYSAASQLFSPAELALAAVLSNRPTRTHASLAVLQVAGQAIGGLLLAPLLWAIAGVSALIVGAAAIYGLVVVAAAIVVWQLRAVERDGIERTPSPDRRFVVALRYLREQRSAQYAVSLLALTDIATRSLLIAGPVYLSRELGLASGQIATLVVMGVGGVLLGLAWSATSVAITRPLRTLRLVWLALVTSAFALAPLGGGVATVTSYGSDVVGAGSVDHHFLVAFVAALPGAFVLGFSLAVAPVVARSVLTASTPVDRQGRVFAAQSAVSHFLVIPILVAAGVATELVAARATVIMVGLIGATAFLFLEVISRRIGPESVGRLEREAIPASTQDAR